VRAPVPAYAIVRCDDGASPEAELASIISVVAVVPTQAEAAAEVDRLSHVNADKRCRYFWAYARYYPDGRAGGEPR
jgi:hypothetical protein